MTHHGRKGGRGLELMLLAVIIFATVALIVGGFFAGLLISIFAAKGGVVVGFLLAGIMWKEFLRYYRYDQNTLRPIEKEKDENDS